MMMIEFMLFFTTKKNSKHWLFSCWGLVEKMWNCKANILLFEILPNIGCYPPLSHWGLPGGPQCTHTYTHAWIFRSILTEELKKKTTMCSTTMTRQFHTRIVVGVSEKNCKNIFRVWSSTAEDTCLSALALNELLDRSDMAQRSLREAQKLHFRVPKIWAMLLKLV